MPRSFPCPACGGSVLTFLRRGETARCRACGAETVVPEEALERPGETNWALTRPAREAPVPPEPRTGPPPPFLSWSFVGSALFIVSGLALLSTPATELAMVSGAVLLICFPWAILLVAFGMALPVLAPYFGLCALCAGLAEYPVCALFVQDGWRRRKVQATIGALAAVHVVSILLAVMLVTVFFRPV